MIFPNSSVPLILQFSAFSRRRRSGFGAQAAASLRETAVLSILFSLRLRAMDWHCICLYPIASCSPESGNNSRSERPMPDIDNDTPPSPEEKFPEEKSPAAHTVPHEPPIAHAPKLIVDTCQPVRPSSRYCIAVP